MVMKSQKQNDGPNKPDQSIPLSNLLKIICCKYKSVSKNQCGTNICYHVRMPHGSCLHMEGGMVETIQHKFSFIFIIYCRFTLSSQKEICKLKCVIQVTIFYLKQI